MDIKSIGVKVKFNSDDIELFIQEQLELGYSPRKILRSFKHAFIFKSKEHMEQCINIAKKLLDIKEKDESKE